MKKKSNIKICNLAIVLAVLFLGVVGCGKSKSNTNSNSNTNTNTNTNSNVSGEEYVIDADYVTAKYNNEHDSNEITSKGEQIKVPFIKFDTEDANKVNEEIKKLYNEYAEKMKATDECLAKGEDKNRPCGIYSIGYKVYSTDTTLSIVVLMQMSGASFPEPDYLVYNFDKKTGKALTLNDLLEIKKISKEELIEETMTNIVALASSEDYEDSGMKDKKTQIESFIKDNMDLNQNKVALNSGVAYFLDSNGKFNIITTLYHDWEAGENVYIISPAA